MPITDPRQPDDVEPPDGDAVAQWIFAAGVVDPLLARELADGVLHFLRTGADHAADVLDVAVRVVRELGHPRVALALEAQTPLTLDATTDRIFPTNLLAAHEAGLLSIGGLSQSGRLVGGLIEAPRLQSELDWLERMRLTTDQYSEFGLLADLPLAADESSLRRLGQAVRLGQRLSTRPLVVNLPGPSGGRPFGRPASLFPDDDSDTDHALRLLDRWENDGCDVRWRWHIAADRLPPRLVDICGAALGLGSWQFVVDGPGRLPDLGFGVTPAEPAVLQAVRVDVEALRRHIASDGREPEDFLAKVASLARLALAVGHAKRIYLRRHGLPGIRSGFRLERSQLALTLAGADQAAAQLLPDADVRRAANFSRQIRRSFVAALNADFAGERWTLDKFESNLAGIVDVELLRKATYGDLTVELLAEAVVAAAREMRHTAPAATRPPTLFT